MRRPKTIPAIEPNAGLKEQLQKRIVGLIRAQTALAAAEVLNALIDSGSLIDGSNMAPDAGLSKKALERIDKEVRSYKAAHPDAARGRPHEPRDELDERRLARPVGPDERDTLTRCDRESRMHPTRDVRVDVHSRRGHGVTSRPAREARRSVAPYATTTSTAATTIRTSASASAASVSASRRR